MKAHIYRAILILIATLIVGCGGGTTGTGEFERKLIIGDLSDQNGSALPGATLTLLDSGDSTTTDGNGNFRLETSLEPGETTLELELNGTASRLVLDLPAGDIVSDLELVFDSESGAVSVASISIVPREDFEAPKPTPTPDNSGEEPKPVDPQQEESILRGTIQFVDGPAVPGAIVTLPQFDLQALTLKDGKFRFTFDPAVSGKSLLVRVSYKNVRDTLTIRNIPAESSIIEVTLRLNGVASDDSVVTTSSLGAEVTSTSIKKRR